MKKLVLSVLSLSVVLMSCHQESLLPENGSTSIESSTLIQKSSSTFEASEEYRYEIYDPGEGEVYLLLEEGLANLFSEEASTGTTDITRGIWYLESGINYAHMTEADPENPYLQDYDEAYTKERSLILDLVEGELQNSDIKSEIIRTYNDVSSEINDEIIFQLIDIQFHSLDDNKISLTVVEKYYVNAVFSSTSPWAPPTVDPATQDKHVGWKPACGSITGIRGAWKDAQIRVKRALPHPAYVNRSAFNSNVFSYSSYPFSIGTRKLDGTYLPGNSNAIFPHHLPPLNASDCLLKAEQDTYAQAMVNQFHSFLVKRYYWDGVAWLQVNASVAPHSQNTDWGYNVDFATWPTKPANHQLTLPWVQ